MSRRAFRGSLVACVIVLSATMACSRRAGTEAEAPAPRSAPVSADPAHPDQGLRLGASAVAARIGSFGWEGDVTWTVEKPGVPPVRMVERHRLRQLASGDFEASIDIDPGRGPGTETGRTVISKGGVVYARGKWAPYRERPTDRGEGARRFRDDSFRMPSDLANLLGPALALRPGGNATLHGRPVRRFEVTLTSAKGEPTALPPGASQDPDTARRRAFLDGRVPTSAAGEVLVDAATGVPMAVTLRASFTQRDDAQLKADVSLDTRVTALGREVAAVHAPSRALPDDRKPKGVARALEAAGLRKRGPTTTPESESESDEDAPDEAP